jgi:hypothetical protein
LQIFLGPVENEDILTYIQVVFTSTEPPLYGKTRYNYKLIYVEDGTVSDYLFDYVEAATLEIAEGIIQKRASTWWPIKHNGQTIVDDIVK